MNRIIENLVRQLGSTLVRPLSGAADGGLIPDPGFVFVFTAGGEQVLLSDGTPIQVPEEFANA